MSGMKSLYRRKKQKRKTRRRSRQRGGNVFVSAMKRSARVLGLREGPKFLSIQNWERLRDSIIQTIQLDPSSGHKSCNNFYTDVNKALDVMKTARVKDSDKNFIQVVYIYIA